MANTSSSVQPWRHGASAVNAAAFTPPNAPTVGLYESMMAAPRSRSRSAFERCGESGDLASSSLGSDRDPVTPPRKIIHCGRGFTASLGTLNASVNVAPPSWDSYRPTVGALGGVKAAAVDRRSSMPRHGCTDEDVLAIPRVHRDPADRAVVGHGKASRDQRPGLAGVSGLVQPRPASESLEPFPSPVPTYKVWPTKSVGSISSEANGGGWNAVLHLSMWASTPWHRR